MVKGVARSLPCAGVVSAASPGVGGGRFAPRLFAAAFPGVAAASAPSLCAVGARSSRRLGDARRLAGICAASLRRYPANSSLWPAFDGLGFAAAFNILFVASLVPCFWGWAARAAPVVFSVSLRSRSFLCRALPPLRFGHAPAARDAPATSLRSAPAWARLVFHFCLPCPFLFGWSLRPCGRVAALRLLFGWRFFSGFLGLRPRAAATRSEWQQRHAAASLRSALRIYAVRSLTRSRGCRLSAFRTAARPMLRSLLSVRFGRRCLASGGPQEKMWFDAAGSAPARSPSARRRSSPPPSLPCRLLLPLVAPRASAVAGVASRRRRSPGRRLAPPPVRSSPSPLALLPRFARCGRCPCRRARRFPTRSAARSGCPPRRFAPRRASLTLLWSVVSLRLARSPKEPRMLRLIRLPPSPRAPRCARLYWQLGRRVLGVGVVLWAYGRRRDWLCRGLVWARSASCYFALSPWDEWPCVFAACHRQRNQNQTFGKFICRNGLNYVFLRLENQ